MHRLIFTTCTFHIFISSCLAQTLDTEKYLEERLNDYSKDHPGVSITVIKGEDILWRKDVGIANIDTGKPVLETTKFNIYSTSKFIVGLAYLKLVYNQDISLNEKIRDIDSSLPEEYDDITIGHLLNHTSGIRHYKGKKDWINFANLNCESPMDAMQYFIDDPLDSSTGEKQLYTTYGMVVLSHILEKITDQNFQDAINDILPFSSDLELDGVDKAKATPYVRKGKEFKEYLDLNAKCKFGGGGFIATSNQLAEAGQMLYSGEIAPLSEIKQLFRQQWQDDKNSGIAFGTGAGISNESFRKPDILYIALGGGSPGGRSYLFTVADLQISVAITANMEGDGEDSYQLARDIIMKIAEGE